MIEIMTNREKLKNELADVARLFLICGGGISITHEAEDGMRWRDAFEVCAFGGLRTQGFEAPAFVGERLETVRRRKRFCKNALYAMLKQMSGYRPPWGSLTGIRPTRLLYEAMQNGTGLEEAADTLAAQFDLLPEKARMLADIYLMQRKFYEVSENAYDIYIGIPFCPTRCSYCSFASADLKSGGKYVEDYMDALLREIRAGAQDMITDGKKPRAVYVGGGTPTSLSPSLLLRLLETAAECFKGAIEFTVEAGRPDSIDREKLLAIKRAGATRISINPQTMNDKTLAAIGRAHSAEDITRAFGLARELGFKNINADLIAALPGEGLPEFDYTLSRMEDIKPESLTVHTLAIKRTSLLKSENYVQADAQIAQEMVNNAYVYTKKAGYAPYYLYRQKYMAGNLENVGYCLPGFQCAYNIDIMEETTPILAFGAGAISKWVYDRQRRIERAPNVKNISEYISRIDEMIDRKRKLYRISE